MLPDPRSSVEIADSPEMFSVMTICVDDGDQRNQLGDALRPGVKGITVPWPLDGVVKMSPPITPSSLINPPMNAMLFPSGDQRTFASCIFWDPIHGWKSGRTAPDSALIAKRSATYQLSSPSPGAAK